MLCSYYLVADREANCFALSVYALREGAIREGNTVTLLEPFFHNVCVSWQGKVKISPFSSNGVLHCFQFLRSHFHILWLHLRVCLPISRAP
jgi:hypothetical protein